VDWINLAQNVDQWRAVVNTMMMLRVVLKVEFSWLSERLLVFQEGLCSVELGKWVQYKEAKHMSQESLIAGCLFAFTIDFLNSLALIRVIINLSNLVLLRFWTKLWLYF
jgi:hypothetical protein